MVWFQLKYTHQKKNIDTGSFIDSKKHKPTNSAILVVNPNIYDVYSVLKWYKNFFKKNCVNRCLLFSGIPCGFCM